MGQGRDLACSPRPCGPTPRAPSPSCAPPRLQQLAGSGEGPRSSSAWPASSLPRGSGLRAVTQPTHRWLQTQEPVPLCVRTPSRGPRESRVTETEQETFWEGLCSHLRSHPPSPVLSPVSTWNRPGSGDFTTSGLMAPSSQEAESTSGRRGAAVINPGCPMTTLLTCWGDHPHGPQGGPWAWSQPELDPARIFPSPLSPCFLASPLHIHAAF